MSELAATVDRLCKLSREQVTSPWQIDWPDELPADAWYFPPELISVRGTYAFEQLDEPTRKKLSLLEAANFFSLNIHGERALIAGLSDRLYRQRTGAITPYLHHFLEEENRHMVYFGEFCTRYARVYPEKKLPFEREFAAGEEDFLFFAKVMVFEEVVDVYNQRMAADERLHPLVCRINELHHRDELRHLAFGRKLVELLWKEHAPTWNNEVVNRVRETLSQYFAATWREYHNPDVYRDAGLPDAHALARESLIATADARREVGRKCVQFLLSRGILEVEPAL